MRSRERKSLTQGVGILLVASTGLALLAGCTGEPTPPTPRQNADTIVAWLVERDTVHSAEVVPGLEEGELVVDVELDADVSDDEIRAIGEYLEAPFDWTLALDVEVHAGDDRWNHAPGLDSAKIVDPVIWLRNDPRVGTISVDSLSADGSTALADVFETAADFHAAMDDFDSPQRLVIEQSGAGDDGADTQVYVTTAKPFPSAAVDAAAAHRLRRRAPSRHCRPRPADRQLVGTQLRHHRTEG